MHLLVGRCTLDDVPILLCITREEAVAAAKTTREQDVLVIAQRLGLYATECYSLAVLPFDPAGVPGEYTTLRRFDE